MKKNVYIAKKREFKSMDVIAIRRKDTNVCRAKKHSQARNGFTQRNS